MKPSVDRDLSGCRAWRPSVPLGDAHVGIIPAWNAVSLLNPAAAAIWDLLIETRNLDDTITGYARRLPHRARTAHADVGACLDAWEQQGLFRAPGPSEEDLELRDLEGRPARDLLSPPFRRTISLAGNPVSVEVENPTLATVVADLLVDFPDTDDTPKHTLQAAGPAGGWVLSVDGQAKRVAPNLVQARGQVVAELVRLAADDDGWRATIHGAVLSGRSGAIFLAGASGAGKSTLSAGLVALGWRILAEDIAAFGPGWTVCPMPFALSIKEGAVDALRPAFPDLPHAPLHALGPRRVRYQGVPPQGRAEHPERPRLILEVCYTAALAAQPARLEPLSPIEALGLFMNEESFVDFERTDPEGFLDFVEETPAYRLCYGDFAAAERAIVDRLAFHDRRGER